MSLTIFGPDVGPIPRPVYMRLECDGCDRDLLGDRNRITFMFNGYIAQRRRATELGWRICGDGKVFGPCCAKGRREQPE